MNKKELQQWAQKNGFGYSYSGREKTLFLQNYKPGMKLEMPSDTKGVNIVGLEHHKLS